MFIQAKLIRRLALNHGLNNRLSNNLAHIVNFSSHNFFSFSCSLEEVKIPRARKGPFVQLSPKGLLTFCLHDPSQMDLFRLYILFSQYRSCDDTQEI